MDEDRRVNNSIVMANDTMCPANSTTPFYSDFFTFFNGLSSVLFHFFITVIPLTFYVLYKRLKKEVPARNIIIPPIVITRPEVDEETPAVEEVVEVRSQVCFPRKTQSCPIIK